MSVSLALALFIALLIVITWASTRSRK